MGIEYINDTKCRLVVYNGTDLKGKPKRYKKTVTYKSERDAKRQYNKFEQEILNGVVTEKTIKVKEMVNMMLDSKRDIKPTTMRGYKMIRNRIEKTLGNPKAKDVTKRDIDTWIAYLIKEDYSPKSIKDTISLLSQAYKQAIEWDMLNKNPCEKANIPKQVQKRPMRYLKDSELADYLGALSKEQDLCTKVTIELALFLGLRRSEILGLKREHFDNDNNLVFVSETRHRVDKSDYDDSTKSISSERVLTVPKFIMADVIKLFKDNEEHPIQSDYLIQNALGELPAPNTVSKWVKVFASRNNLPSVSIHGLRHSNATLLHSSGHNLLELSAHLGHRKPSTTANIYAHLFKEASVVEGIIANELDENYGSIMSVEKL